MKQVSFNLQRIKPKIHARYAQGRFIFDVDVRSIVYVTERLFPYDVMEPYDELEQKIAANLEQQFNTLIRKLQKRASIRRGSACTQGPTLIHTGKRLKTIGWIISRTPL